LCGPRIPSLPRKVTLASWITSLSFLISDHWFVAFLIRFIFYNLLSPVRKQDVVSSLSFLVLSVFFMAKIAARIGVVNFVRKFVISWFLEKKSLP
jgi:hypothetical protein